MSHDKRRRPSRAPLEEELSLEIPDEELEGIRTVGDAVDFIAQRVGATA